MEGMLKLLTGGWAVLSRDARSIFVLTLIVVVLFSSKLIPYFLSAMGEGLCVVTLFCICAQRTKMKAAT